MYIGMDIGTGKDLPVNVKCQRSNVKSDRKKIGYYVIDKIRVWGYDLVDPKEEFSVAQYVKVASKIIADILKRKKLPILVGGTGLYIKGVVDGIPTAAVPQDKALRKSLAGKRAAELFEILSRIDPIKAGSLNISDRKNPRRLIRAIEIADSRINVVGKPETKLTQNFLFIGLRAPKDLLHQMIEKRIRKRIKDGFDKEVRKLLKRKVSWGRQSMDSIGYKQWRAYIEGKRSKEEVVRDWYLEERKYSKRQMTWFRKDRRIKWFDISKPGWRRRVEILVKRWHNQVDKRSNIKNQNGISKL